MHEKNVKEVESSSNEVTGVTETKLAEPNEVTLTAEEILKRKASAEKFNKEMKLFNSYYSVNYNF